jgi:SSS family solute:Na+ symporter
MGPVDWVVLWAYAALLAALSWWVGRGQRTEADHHVGGRDLPWWSLGISTMATQSSANSFIGIPAFVALVPGGGLTWLQYELALPLALWVVMRWGTPVFRGLELVSIYDYLEQRFDRSTRLLLSAVFLVSRALATGVALYAAALVIEVCTGLPIQTSLLLLGAATVAYDMLGGMKAVVWSDVAQMSVLVAGALLCTVLALDSVGGWNGVWEVTDPSRLRAFDWGHGLGDGARAPLWGFLVGGTVLYIAYYGVDQSQVQRQLSARSTEDARRALAFNAFFRFPLTLMYAAMGLAVGAAVSQSAELTGALPNGRWDALMPVFIRDALPEGVRGLVIAAVLAAAMSSLDSALNSLSAATTQDFLMGQDLKPPTLATARWVTLFWGVFIVAVAWHAASFSASVIEGINRVGAVFYGPLLAAFGCGILDRHATAAGVKAGVATGLVVNLGLWGWLGQSLFWMWWNVSGLLGAVVVCWVVSRRFRAGECRALPSFAQASAPIRPLWNWSLAGMTGLMFILLAVWSHS